MKNVMATAWEIAKAGQAKFGGNVKEYFAQALKLAWAQAKAPKAPQKVELELTVNKRKGKTWVARIVGLDKVFGFEREFVSSSYDEDGESVWRLVDGLYEICEVGNRKFIVVKDGDYSFANKQDVEMQVA